MRRRARLAFIALVLLAGCTTGESAGKPADSPTPAHQGASAGPSATVTDHGDDAAASISASRPCGTRTPPTTWRHVIWVWMENHGYDQIIGGSGSDAARDSPFVNGTLVRRCGLATEFHNETHPSLPNYLAAVAGTTGGVTSDCTPQQCPQSARTIFNQATDNGHIWKVYTESMPSRCALDTTGQYAARHNPAVYYPDIRSGCHYRNVRLRDPEHGLGHDLRASRLPAFSIVVPNLCDDTHDCSIRTGDDWLARWLPVIFSSSTYARGATAVFLTWDEGEHGSFHGENCTHDLQTPSCHVATVVMSPSTPPGRRSAIPFSHYSMLETTERMLGFSSKLGHAADGSTSGMWRAFGL